jgi:hypothetical protein
MYILPTTMFRRLRFLGLVLLNLLIAIAGTAILDTAIWKLVPAHSLGAILYKELILSVACAGLIGFGMWRVWRSEAAKWTWVLPILWFAFGLLTAARHGIWGPLSVRLTANVAAETRGFFLFTIPLTRAVAYSVGAYISSLVLPQNAASVQ